MAMSAHRATIPMMAAVRAMLALASCALHPGCGSGVTEYDKAALYTPESLAKELAFRFHDLKPEAKAAAVRYRHTPKDEQKIAAQRAKSEQAKNKVTGGPPEKKKKRAGGPQTIDDLLADIDTKLDLLTGISRADACRKIVETISGDNTLSESDKKQLTELMGRLEGSH
jgi:hypothetical protein